MAIALRNGNSQVNSTTGTVTATCASTAAGSLLVAYVLGGGSSLFSAPAGWTRAIGGANGTNVRVEIWYLANCAAGITSVAFTSANAGGSSAQVAEFTGAATSAVLDQTGSTLTGASGTYTVSTTGNATGDLGALLMGAWDSISGPPAPSSTWGTNVGSGSADGLVYGMASNYLLLASGAQTATVGDGPSTTVKGASLMATFKAASVATVSPPPPLQRLHQAVKRGAYI